jgi:hypothetical protein
MERVRRERVSGQLLLGFLGVVAVGFVGSTLGWLVHDRFAGSCPPAAPESPYGQAFVNGYLAFDLICLAAAAALGVLFLRAESRLGRKHEIGRSIGFLAVLGLGVYQAWYFLLTALTINPVCG